MFKIFLILGFFAGLVLAGVDIVLVALNGAVLPDPPLSLQVGHFKGALGGAADTISRAVEAGWLYLDNANALVRWYFSAILRKPML